MSVALKVETEKPSASALALQLAETLNDAALSSEEAVAFAAQSRNERVKAAKCRELLGCVLERDARAAKGLPPPEPQRRMDPMLTYSAAALAEQLDQCTRRSEEFKTQAEASEQRSRQAKGHATALQADIRAANAREASCAAR